MAPQKVFISGLRILLSRFSYMRLKALLLIFL